MVASYLNADSSVVMPLRRPDQATLIAISSATPGKKPSGNPFGAQLMPQTASSDTPVDVPPPPVVQTAPAAVQPGEDDHVLEDFLAELPRKGDWMDEL